MAEAKAKAAELVEVYIERAESTRDDPNHYVSVNCVNYLLPKGQTSKVPPEVAYEIERSRKAMRHYDATVRELQAIQPKG